jgi:hypothetical protein
LSELSHLLTGITLIAITIGSLFACLPRRGKTAWFVGKPFLAPAVTIAMIATLAIGFLLIAAYFTTIDEATLAGTAKHL